MHRGNSPESIVGRPAGQKDAITGPLYEMVFKRQPQFAHVSIKLGISAMRNLLYFAKNRNITECGSAQIPTNPQSNNIFHRSLEKRLAARIRKAQFIIISDAICLTKQICSWFSDFSSVSFISQIESKTPGQLKTITGNRIWWNFNLARTTNSADYFFWKSYSKTWQKKRALDKFFDNTAHLTSWK